MPPIFVINLPRDIDRKNRAQAHYESAKLSPIFIYAEDGHGDLTKLAPFEQLLGDAFWGKPEIKPGAFACFISHRKIWQKMIDENIEFAFIAEDDSTPAVDLLTKCELHKDELIGSELVFLNDRMSERATTTFQPFGEVVVNMLSEEAGKKSQRAPGADGYFLSQKTAQTFIALSDIQKVICGVDWFMIYNSWNSANMRHKDVKNSPELKKIWKLLGGAPAKINAIVAKEPWFTVDRDMPSSINHSETVLIDTLRRQLRG